jgi:hypothetical protein
MNATARSKRWWLWAPLLGLAAWLALFADKTPSGAVLAVPAVTSSPQRTTAIPAVTATDTTSQNGIREATRLGLLIPRDTLILPGKTGLTLGKQLFASGSWTPPPPPVKPLAPLPPAAPTAPALPFTFIGKKLEAGVWEVFLARGEQSFVVREGAVIENTYRVTKISPPNLSLSYLPLGHTQNLSIGASE